MRSFYRMDRLSFASRKYQEIFQGVEPQFSEPEESTRKIFQLPWFARCWVVQEAVLNPDIMFYCGMTTISWPKLYLASEFLPDYIWMLVHQQRSHDCSNSLGGGGSIESWGARTVLIVLGLVLEI